MLSVRAKKNPSRPILKWDARTTIQDVASRVEDQISTDWEALERTQTNSYNDYVDICNKAVRFDSCESTVALHNATT